MQRLTDRKALIIMGPRQTGKTTLLYSLFGKGPDVLWLNGDDPQTTDLLEDISISRWRLLIGDRHIVIVDEAQRIKNIGIKLKLVTDELSHIKLLVSGSSSLDLASEIKEPLTGRKWEFMLYPLSFEEMVQHHGWAEEKKLLHQRMIYGYYPEVVTSSGRSEETLQELADSYLYKDILNWQYIRKPEKITKLLQALAFQLGNEVSYNELGNMLDMDNETVEKYIRLLEQCFVIFRLPPLSRNLRKELKTKRKIYFYDNGIRNAIISQYQPLEIRQDVGALWENFIISERIKFLNYHKISAHSFFWRTRDQQEIDYIEERNGTFNAFEMKWNPKRKKTFPSAFIKNYPTDKLSVISPKNMESFLLAETDGSG